MANIVLYAGDGTYAQSAPIATALEQTSSVETVSPVYPVSSNPALRSCDYLLSDSPSAAPFVTSAEAALVSAELVPAALAKSFVVANISDDPLHVGDYIVSLHYVGSEATPPAAAPSSAHFSNLNGYAVVETLNHLPIAVGRAPW